jgi:hypothetical protein
VPGFAIWARPGAQIKAGAAQWQPLLFYMAVCAAAPDDDAIKKYKTAPKKKAARYLKKARIPALT